MSLHFLTLQQAQEKLTERDFLVTDRHVAEAWPSFFEGRKVIVLPPGESTKSWEQAGLLLQELARLGANRKSRVVAVGGGVVGDLAGFAAASFMRGAALVQIPTSLLAMVDSSVGGKVGVDLPEGKNLAGAFWPAEEVLIAPEFLDTLPPREWLCGAAEVWKYGAIMDEGLYHSLASSPVGPGREGLEDVIRTCVEHKQRVVAEDPHETTGLRAILNFGHTYGHAVEAALGYQTLTHGEAISIGMVVEARLGEALGVTERGTAKTVEEGLSRQGLPVEPLPHLEPESLISWMARDKKRTGEGLAFSLLTKLGQCKLVKGVSKEEVLALLRSQ